MLKEFFQKIRKELIIRYAPLGFPTKRHLLFDKYLKVIRIKGKNINLKRDLRLVRSNGLVLGQDITIEGGGLIDATAGVLLGDKVVVEKNTKISSVLKSHGQKRYDPVIIGAGNKIKGYIAPGTILQNKFLCKGLSDFEGQITFIVSTGRSGSKAIALMLDQHPEAICFHDSFPHLYSWSCDFLYKKKTEEEIMKKLKALYNSMDIRSRKVYGQSDQKLAPLIPILAKMFPNAKFIWLIRKADSFLNSSYPRGWFDNSEFGYPSNPKEFFPKKVTPSAFDADHRTNLWLAGEIDEQEWQKMTAFERNCRYWYFWNNLIEKNLLALSSKRWIKVNLEDLLKERRLILKFLGLVNFDLNAEKVNTAKYKKVSKSEWTEEMQLIYNQNCEKGMNRWFS